MLPRSLQDVDGPRCPRVSQQFLNTDVFVLGVIVRKIGNAVVLGRPRPYPIPGLGRPRLIPLEAWLSVIPFKM